MDGIIQCPKCHGRLITEEVSGHVCMESVKETLMFPWGECYASDGKTWYRWFPSDETFQRNSRRGLPSSPPRIVFIL